ncbi:D-galactoside-specific lectin [Magallana gigas]|uniref:D-galactoside-specific lectin n=1 Tax=Magallana gigas TaxID=29159 RepID=UPI003342A572
MKTLFLFTCLLLLFEVGESWVWGGSSWYGATTTSICQNQKLTLHCGHGRVIKIRHANYGRTNYFTCPRGNLHTDDCESSDTKEIVKKRCNGRRKCTLTATNSIFGNPCHGTTKYLEVTFKCIHDDEKRSLKNVK